MPPRPACVLTLPHDAPRPKGRDALPAGHPVAWGMLLDGTALQGEAFPDRDA